MQKLIAKVQMDKAAGRVPAAPPLVGGAKAADAVVAEAQSVRCKRCNNLLQEDWKACPKCGTPVE